MAKISVIEKLRERGWKLEFWTDQDDGSGFVEMKVKADFSNQQCSHLFESDLAAIFKPESRDDKEQACMEAMNEPGSIRENLAALRAAAGEYDPSVFVGEFEAVVAAERRE